MRNRPSVLTWIIAFKAVKTTILTAVGVGLLTVRDADPVDVLLRLALAFHLPLTSRLLNRLPIELYEIAREMHPIRVLVLLANVAIVVYLCRRKDVFE